MDVATFILRDLNNATMSPEWRLTMDRVRAYIGNGSDRGDKATYLLALVLGCSRQGQDKMEDALRKALTIAELDLRVERK